MECFMVYRDEGNIVKIIKEQEHPINNLLPSDICYVYNRKE